VNGKKIIRLGIKIFRASKLGDGSDPNEDFCIEWIAQFPNMEEFNIKCIKWAVIADIMFLTQNSTVMNSNELLGAFNAIGNMPHLKTVNYESLGCRMGDLEMMTILFGITKLKQIKNLNFKIIQYNSDILNRN